GYMNHIQEPWQFAHWTQIGCACFVIDNRGQGGLTKDRVPYQTIWHEAPMGRGFLDKEDWYQRRLFADHLRSVEVVRTFTEINQDQIILRGGSQGGGVVLMVNSLVDFPILATFADVPSHSCLENRVA
ncbi:acetylxylan esterase, partial [Enterococcus gallinarum]